MLSTKRDKTAAVCVYEGLHSSSVFIGNTSLFFFLFTFVLILFGKQLSKQKRVSNVALVSDCKKESYKPVLIFRDPLSSI